MAPSSSADRIKHGETNPTRGTGPGRKGILKRGLSAIEAIMDEADGDSPRFESDSVRPGKKPRKDNKEGYCNNVMHIDCIEYIEEDEEEAKHNGNKRGTVMKPETVIELSDSDEEAVTDIPVEVARRPPSEYKHRLIEVLKRPVDKAEYIELMKKSSRRTKKIVYKELRPVTSASGTKRGRPRIRERAIDMEEESKSFFDWYPELEMKVKMASRVRGLTLLRGFFFWLENSSWEQSFEPWIKWCKEIEVEDIPSQVIICNLTPE